MSRLVLMGSGETAPTMVRTHRELFETTPAGAAVLVDTPFAFQVNRLDLVARTRLYFAESVGRDIDVLHWPPLTEDPLATDRALALLDAATWVFAGPGSPTYALRQWQGTALPEAIERVARRGGTVVLGSAGAVTAGCLAVPVYEIYKVGEEPRWVPGMDVLAALTGLRAAVLPHYDNKEGGRHDTRYCYLGESRLRALEADLPTDVGVVGVDEHTAVVLDLAAQSVTVLGTGGLSLRRDGRTTTLSTGTIRPLPDLAALLSGHPPTPADRIDHHAAEVARSVSDPGGAGATGAAGEATSLREEADLARQSFEAAERRRDASGCAAAVLGLEDALVRWSSDTLQSADADHARRVLRALVVRLGDLAAGGLADPATVVGPYVDLLLDLRTRARGAGDFATADRIRDALVAAGVEVRDSAAGTDWTLARG